MKLKGKSETKDIFKIKRELLISIIFASFISLFYLIIRYTNKRGFQTLTKDILGIVFTCIIVVFCIIILILFLINKEYKKILIKILSNVLLVFFGGVLVLSLSQFLSRSVIDGTSMLPTLNDNQSVIVYNYNFSPKKNNIVGINLGDKQIIKRVYATPKDKLGVQEGFITVNDKKIKDVNNNFIIDSGFVEKLKKGELFIDEENKFPLNDDYTIKEGFYICLGDNINNSKDSRFYGAFTDKMIFAKYIFGF